jgi:nucleoid-associated protein YgaU
MTALEFNELKRGTGEARGVQSIAKAINGLDATSELYDEAVELARDGSLGRSRDRLRMLLCLDPHDGQAHLLLSKVFGAQGRWTDALTELDQATACGMRLPEGLREGFENKRDASQRNRSEKVVARVNNELNALREEARRLRAENSRLERETRDQGDKARMWMSATAVVSGLGLFALLVGAVFGGDDAPDEVVEAPGIEAEAPVEPAIAAIAPGIVAPEAPVAAPPPVEPEPVVVEPAGPRTYTVQKGDNLSAVSQKVYGKSTRWEAIRDANKATLGGGIDLQVGMELVIPE